MCPGVGTLDFCCPDYKSFDFLGHRRFRLLWTLGQMGTLDLGTAGALTWPALWHCGVQGQRTLHPASASRNSIPLSCVQSYKLLSIPWASGSHDPETHKIRHEPGRICDSRRRYLAPSMPHILKTRKGSPRKQHVLPRVLYPDPPSSWVLLVPQRRPASGLRPAPQSV